MKTYQKMDEEIVRLLKFRGDAITRIEELEYSLDLERGELCRIRTALDNCGIGGIFDVFDSPADAICQMAGYIKELQKRVEEAEAVIWR